MSMLRLAERVMGEGDLCRAGERVFRTSYELSRYLRFAVMDASLVARGEIVDGHLHVPTGALAALLGTDVPLTLHLEDGRRVDLYIVSPDGAVTSADERGFYDA